MAHEYARWFFGPDCAQQAAAMMLKIEEALNKPLYGSGAVGEAGELLRACEARDPALLDNWRWLGLRLAVLMLTHVQRVLERDRRLAAHLRYRISAWRSWSDLPNLRQNIAYLEGQFAATDGLLREIVWTRDRLFALHKLAVRGVARLQNSYMKLDVVRREWREALARFEREGVPPFPEARQAVLAPLAAAEDSLRMAVQGIPLAEHIQEFSWESGAPRW